MSKTILFVVVLAGGVATAAWMGKEDASGSAHDPAAALNTYVIRRTEALPTFSFPGMSNASASAMNRAYQQAYLQRKVYQSTRSLLPIAKYLDSAQDGDWRARFREPEQNYSQYLKESRQAQGTLIIQPIGNLPTDQKMAIGHVIDAISSFFGMPTECNTPIPYENLPPTCFRVRNNTRQINAEALMEQVLEKLNKNGVVSVIAVTELDIYPGERWPFESALGWSSFQKGTSVLSTQRIFDNARADRGQNLLRFSKLTIHELAHTFGVKHCSRFNCVMNGCSDLKESDTKPLILCPDCLAKISIATGHNPQDHLGSMLAMCRAKGFSDEARYYTKALQMLR